MRIRRNTKSFVAVAFVLLVATVAQAAYTYSSVIPTNNGTGSGSSQSVAAVLKWNATDTAPHGGGWVVTVKNGYNGIIGGTSSNNFGNLTASFSGTVTFTPPLPSGSVYTIAFMAPYPNATNTGPGGTASTETTVTVP